MKIGDVSRHRRWSDPARRRWYAHHRAVRFARRMRRGATGLVTPPATGGPPD
jgi:hypothetical protein